MARFAASAAATKQPYFSSDTHRRTTGTITGSRMLGRIGVFLLLSVLFFGGTRVDRAAATVPAYAVTDLGGLGGNLSSPEDMNQYGHATGYSNKTNIAQYYGYFWNGTTLSQACTNAFGDARGINSLDKMVGTLIITTRVKGKTYTYYHLATCQGTTQTDLGTGPPGCGSGQGWAINDSDAMTLLSCGQAWVLRNGAYTAIGSLGGTENLPLAINTAGVVAGKATNASGSYQPYFYDGIIHAIPVVPNCAAVGHGYPPGGGAGGINNLGEIVGGTCTDPFLYANGQVTDLGDFSPTLFKTGATAINNRGQIVGAAGDGTLNTATSSRAVIYDWATGQWYDLNALASPIPPGVVLSGTIAINDNGQILVQAWIPGGTQYSYLLTPLGPLSTGAPSNVNRPELSGLPILGRPLTATPGTWTGAPASYGYQWVRCDASGANCGDISGASGSTYSSQTGDLGSTIRVRVTATNNYGTEAASSDATSVIQTPLDAYAPKLWYDSQETYRADSAGELTDNCWRDDSGNVHNNVLQDVSGTPIASACPPEMFNYPGPLDPLSLSYLGPNYSTTGNEAASSDLIGEWPAQTDDFLRLHSLPQYANRIYGRVKTYPEGDSILQYWFWYYNQPNFVFGGLAGGHEGDWEGMQIHLDTNGFPIDATYDQHGGGELCNWNQVSRYETHPIAFAAHNSHASYFTSGPHSEDRADGQGEFLLPTVEDISNYASTSWLFWPGHWGGSTGTDFPGAQASPSGPGRKAQWDDPRQWQATSASACSIPIPLRGLRHGTKRGVAPASSRVFVPVPRVTAHRVGQRASVSYCFGSVPTSRTHRPAFVEVSVQSANKHIPPYTRRYEAHLPCGRVNQPLGRGRGPFHVLVSAWTRHGWSSRVVTVPLR